MALNSAFAGAINGTDDPTQPKNRPAPAATPQKFFDPSASAAAVTRPKPSSDAGANGGNVAAFNPAQNLDASSTNASGQAAPKPAPEYAVPKPKPITPIINPTTDDLAARGALRTPTGTVAPGAAGAMASAIPAAATTGPLSEIRRPTPNPLPADAGTGNAAAGRARAVADGGVVQPDGSIAFSNIPGKPSVLSQEKIAELSKVNVIPAASFTNPGLGVATSLATGGRVTPGVSADNVPRPVPQNDAYDRAQSDNLEAQRRAQSDLLSIATEDPRSPLGIAARADRINASSNFGTRTSRRIAYENAMGGLYRQAMGGEGAQASLGQEDLRTTGEEARAAAQSDSAAQHAEATRYAADQRADAQVSAAQVNASRPRQNPARDHGAAMAYSRAYDSAIQSGASEDEAIARAQRNRAAFLWDDEQQNNEQQAQNSEPQPPRNPTPTAANAAPGQSNAALTPGRAAINFLMANPQYAYFFDAKYGKGMAAKYLGAQ